MKKIISLLTVILLVSAIFVGCKSEDSTPDDGQVSILPASDLPLILPQNTTAPEIVEISDYTAKLFQTHDYTDEVKFPLVTKFTSLEQLNAYLEEYQAKIGYYSTVTAEDIIGSTPEEFFKDNILVIAVFSEGSGSIKYSFNRLELADGVITAFIDIDSPEMGTTDMAQWQLFLTLPIEYAENDVIVLGVKSAAFKAGENSYSKIIDIAYNSLFEADQKTIVDW